MTRRHSKGPTRRRFLALCGLSLPAVRALTREAEEKRKSTVAEAFDLEIESFMRARKVPGGAVAVAKNGRLVYARAYGWADFQNQVPAKPVSLFRVASLSKPITAAAVLNLVQGGRLDLDDPAFARLSLPPLLADAKKLDPRLRAITVRHLLQHTGGWDREQSFDPMFRPREIAKATGTVCPPGPNQIIKYMLGRPLDFDPGSRYAYSNFGYCVLGRIIEKITGASYEQYVRESVLAPMGLRHMRLGKSRREDKAPLEVTYYMADHSTVSSVFDDKVVPWPYGGFCLEAMDAHGGWLASVIDLARFAAALDSGKALDAAMLQTMAARPAPPTGLEKDGKPAPVYYGCGWNIRPVSKLKANYWHSGSLPGTFSLLVRRWDGLTWVVVFNQRSEDAQWPDTAIDPALHRAADVVQDWPAHDLFADFK